MGDPIHHPSHYGVGRFTIECIEITRHMTFPAGNAVKYVWRWQEKNGVEDLRKALVYLNWALEDGAYPILPGLVGWVETLIDKHVEPFIVPGFGYEAIPMVAGYRLGSAATAIEEVIRRNGPVLDQVHQ